MRRAVLLALLGILGCSEGVGDPPRPSDLGGSMDAGSDLGVDMPRVLDGVDSDGDGLCDDYELYFRLDPEDPDSDGDGFPDYWETVLAGLAPNDAQTPAAEDLVFLREGPRAAAQVPLTAVVTGAGQDYLGAFEALDAMDPFGQDAGDHFAGSVAAFAEPIENVGRVDEESEAFRGVVGRTLLGWEVRLAFGSVIPRLCHRVFPFRYLVVRSDGRPILADRRLLVILAPGETLEGGPFCAPQLDRCVAAPPGAVIP
ncbi:MAG: hypothetical protein AAGH15_02135 [Myxococcota bacterium]